MPIEEVLVGENVLAQDIETGELSYRPVLVTTVRPPLPTIGVKVAGEELLVSRGHPFWVSGSGWRMTKELKVGNKLHTPRGSIVVLGLEERSNYPTYNLVVAGFNTYFVGQSQILVHDNNIRGATSTIVPGLPK